MPTPLRQIIGSANRWVVTSANTTMVPGTSYLSAIGASDPDFSSVTSLIPFDGTNGATTITDVLGIAWTANGNAQLTTTNPRFGTACALFDGAGDFFSTANTAAFTFPGDFTVEFWLFISSTRSGNAGVFFTCSDTNGSGGFGIYIPSGTASLQVYNYVTNANVFGAAATVGTGAWAHIALARSSGVMTIYVNGVNSATASVGSSFTAQAGNVCIGSIAAGIAAGNGVIGRIDDFRVTVGVARYTSNFTPPTSSAPSASAPAFTVPSAITAGDSFVVSSAARVVPGAGRQIGTAGVGTAVTLNAGQTLRIVARNATQLDIV